MTDAQPPWAAGLGVTSERKRRTAIDRIVRMRPAPIPELRTLAARHSNAYTRAGALAALIRLRPRDMRGILARAARDPAMTVRMRVVGAMLTRPDVRILSGLIGDASGGVRINAIDVAASRRLPATASAIRRRLTDQKWYVRQHAARAAAALRDQRAVSGLSRLLSDAHPAVRRAAAEALARIGR